MFYTKFLKFFEYDETNQPLLSIKNYCVKLAVDFHYMRFNQQSCKINI